MLSVMLEVITDFPEYQFVVAAAPSIEPEFYQHIIRDKNVKLISGQTHAILQNTYAALVTSGTATLETALFDVPEVVVYKGSYISYQIARRVIDQSIIIFISLVNIIANKEIVKELIQKEMTISNVRRELKAITVDNNIRIRISNDYTDLKKRLGGGGASAKTADLIINILNA